MIYDIILEKSRVCILRVRKTPMDTRPLGYAGKPACLPVRKGNNNYPLALALVEYLKKGVGASVVKFFASLLMFLIFLPFITLSIYTSPQDLIQSITDPVVIDALKNSVIGATYATLLSAVFAVPIGYAMARNTFKSKKVWLALLNIPAMVPHSVGGIMILLLFSPKYSPLGKFLAERNFFITGTMLGIVLAMWIVSVPYYINAAFEAFASVPPGLERTAMSLGAPPLMAFLTITFPLALRGLITGAIQTWARAVSEFGAVVMVSYYPKTAPVLVYELFNNFGLSKAIPVSVITILISSTIFLLLRFIGDKNA